ncbi:hypothetical protein PybrP1_003647 [[Pythium] brassicae (nom. inval.)]|nr:hypothetical protein PybrP1_003647 [[Pythium] brassicae (nom. inval.)]
MFVLALAMRALVVLAFTGAICSTTAHDDARWSIAAGGSGDELWRADHPSPSVCALDAVHIQTHWRMPPHALLRCLSTASSSSEWADEHFYSVLELVAVAIVGAPSGLTITNVTAPTERRLSELVSIERLAQAQRKQEEAQQRRREQQLRCEFDDEFCTPQLVGIRLPDVLAPHQTLAANHTVALEFAQPTSRPLAHTKDALDRFVHFAEYIGDELAGEWSADGRTLRIRVLSLTPALLKPLEELMQGLLHTTLVLENDDDAVASIMDERVLLQYLEAEAGTMLVATDGGSLRVEPLGEYRLRLSVSVSRHGADEQQGAIIVFTTESPVVRVVTCERSAVVLASSLLFRAVDEQRGPETRAPPSYALDGVLSLAGQEALVLPHSAIGMREPGSWSLSFWLLSTDEPTGSFRSLVFNGDGTGEMRTPSVWWKPDENKFVLRASTTASLDDGLDSEQRLPTNEWVHVGFRFRNCSASAANASSAEAVAVSESEQCADARAAAAAERPWFYGIALFVNGAKDSEVFFDAPAIANSGPLHVGKGPWTDGMRGFVSNLRMFPVAVSDAQLRDEYLDGRALHVNFPSPAVVDNDDTNPDNVPIRERHRRDHESLLFLRSPARDSHPAPQISYLLQRHALQTHRRVGNSDSSGELAVSAISSKSLQESTYRTASAMLERCDSRAWDVLLEAAELGHPQAQRDVGKAHLYGSYDFPDACAGTGGATATASGAVPVRLDFVRARDELEAALSGGAFDAAKHLALLFAASGTQDGSPDSEKAAVSPLANLTLGLYHVAAIAGREDAFAVLGRRYTEGDGVAAALEVGAFHYLHAAADASVAYHALGQQPLHEMNRLYDAFQRDIATGQRGDDDALIQLQKLRADQGDVAAMAAMGDLYYWGTRGVARDHALAHAYFARAARADHVAAQSALAGMLLKGEGVPQDNASAIHWYERAAARNHTRALNGLGFVHFYGTGGVAENRSLALALFERAAANEEDGDSVFNAGYCHALGLGTAANRTRATEYYAIAATKFGHFDAIFELGKAWMAGVEAGVTERNPERAVVYLKAASDGGGRWGRSVRKGFDSFLGGEFRRAAVFYHDAQELGYPVATSNLAFLYDQRLLVSSDSDDTGGRRAREVRAFRYLVRTSVRNRDTEVLVRIGDFHFYGLAGLRPDAREALRWYSRASAEGVDAGAYSVGYMHEFGVGVPVNLERAQRYYERVLELTAGSTDVYVVVRLALARLAIRRWLLTHAPSLAASLAAFSSESSQLHTSNSSDGSGGDDSNRVDRRRFSELGGLALEDVWSAAWSSLYPLVLLAALALVGFITVVSRR